MGTTFFEESSKKKHHLSQNDMGIRISKEALGRKLVVGNSLVQDCCMSYTLRTYDPNLHRLTPVRPHGPNCYLLTMSVALKPRTGGQCGRLES